MRFEYYPATVQVIKIEINIIVALDLNSVEYHTQILKCGTIYSDLNDRVHWLHEIANE